MNGWLMAVPPRSVSCSFLELFSQGALMQQKKDELCASYCIAHAMAAIESYTGRLDVDATRNLDKVFQTARKLDMEFSQGLHRDQIHVITRRILKEAGLPAKVTSLDLRDPRDEIVKAQGYKFVTEFRDADLRIRDHEIQIGSVTSADSGGAHSIVILGYKKIGLDTWEMTFVGPEHEKPEMARLRITEVDGHRRQRFSYPYSKGRGSFEAILNGTMTISLKNQEEAERTH